MHCLCSWWLLYLDGTFLQLLALDSTLVRSWNLTTISRRWGGVWSLFDLRDSTYGLLCWFQCPGDQDYCFLEWLCETLLLGRGSKFPFWDFLIGGIFLSSFFQAFGSLTVEQVFILPLLLLCKLLFRLLVYGPPLLNMLLLCRMKHLSLFLDSSSNKK